MFQADLLGQISLFEGLTDEDREALGARLTEREYKRFLLKGTVRDFAFWIYEHRDPRTLSRRIVNKIARDAARYYRARQDRHD